MMKSLVAHRATGNLYEPIVNAFVMENVKTAKHPAFVIICDRA